MSTFLEPQTGRVFTSPNVTEAPPASILPSVSGPDDLSIDNIGKLCFMSSKFPHLPYASHRPVNNGTLFSCLRLSDHQLPIVNSQGTFSLDPTIRNKWVELDNFLTRVFRTLPVGCPPDFSPFTMPSHARYAYPHKSKEGCGEACSQHIPTFDRSVFMGVIAVHQAREG